MQSKRILKELEDVARALLEEICFTGKQLLWVLQIVPPYAGGVFLINLLFPPDYPFKPHQVLLLILQLVNRRIFLPIAGDFNNSYEFYDSG